jgi:glycine/D-amino acid oxidase-like deaminating enzyme
VNAAGAWGNEIAEQFGETSPMFEAAPPNFVTEPLPYFITPALQDAGGAVIIRQVERGNVIVGFYPRGPADRVQNRAPVAPEKTLRRASQMRCGSCRASRRAGDPRVVRHRGVSPRHASRDGLEPGDEEPVARLRLLRTRVPAQPRRRLHTRRDDR